MKEPTILVTGGHPTPALAVIEEIQKIHKDWNIVWVGRKYAFEGTKEYSPEYHLLKSMDIPFINLMTGRLQRSLSLYTIPSLFKIPFGFFQSVMIVRKIKPSVILSFGGYIALPITIAAYVFHIPVITHEQVHTLGLANSIIAKLAQKVCVTYEDTLSRIPKGKGVLTGLPIRSAIFSPPLKPTFSVPNIRLRILYITGGSTGATSLNDKIFPAIPELLKDFIVIHQTGSQSYARAMKIRNQCKEKEDRYIIGQYFQVSDVSWIYHNADLVIGRSGANTIGELLNFHIPAILVPLPWAGGSEQEKNAEYYIAHEKGCILKQDDITPDTLHHTAHMVCGKAVAHPRAESKSYETPAHKIVDEIQLLLTL